MHLTTIKLSGFKSFADPTTIAVPGRLVAVVGPNGCGKSNVIDAVRWVLGESSAKQLRGQSMQDVIFNGATSRKSVSRASVELVFNNTDHQLQGSWGQFAEVSIKRVLTRQGDSAYYINQQQVRRKDITDLFLGTGVGARGYAVIEQGMISRIIEAKPEELRAYIEEAAGVSKYKERRRETEIRLKDTKDNLTRLHDLQSELNRQIEKLERQAKTASSYQELKDTLDHKQNLFTFARLQQTRQDSETATLRCQELTIKQQELDNTLQQINEESYQLQVSEHNEQNSLHQVQNKWALIREQLARLEEQIRHHQNLQERLEREKLQANIQLGQISQQQQEITSALTQSESALEEKQLILEELYLQSEQMHMSIPALEAKFMQQESIYLSQKDKINQLKREYDLTTQSQNHLQKQQGNLSQRQYALEQEAKELNAPTQSDLEQAQNTTQQQQTLTDTLNKDIELQESGLATTQDVLQQTQQNYQQQQSEYLTLKAQADALSSLLKEQEGNESFWKDHQADQQPALWQSVEVDPKWQHALSVYLGEKLNAREGALQNFHRPNNQATLIQKPQNQRHTQQYAEEENSLRSKIQAKTPFASALDDWLNQVYCCNQLEEALSLQNTLNSGTCLITPEGDMIYSYSVTLFGQTETDNQLSRQRKVNLLHEQIARLMPELNQTEQKISDFKSAIEARQHRLFQTKSELKIQNEVLRQAHLQETRLLEKAKQTQLRHNHIQTEQEELNLQQEENAFELETLNQTLLTLEEGLMALEQEHQNSHKSREEIQLTLRTQRLQALEANRQLGLEQLAEQKTRQQIEYFKEQLQQLSIRKDELIERQSELTFEFENDQQNPEQQETLNQLLEEQHNIEEELNELKIKLSQIQNRGKELNQQHQQLIQKQPKLQQAVQQALLQEQEANLQAQHLLEELKERQANLDLLVNQIETEKISNLAQEIKSLSQQIDGLGAINLAALEELNEASGRSVYLETQVNDLKLAIAALETAITQIDDESNTLFKNTFNAVNEKMQSIFPTLFGGGQAQLEITGEDLLNAGISITARPPGKKNSTIHLLSGGEKALTAMSLIFALFSLNPAPFCLLDEVDAPLDDANTSRFCTLVKEMSAKTQFLYISHNRLTMEMAEQLIGVTMQEKGVSRIVAVDIREALTMRDKQA